MGLCFVSIIHLYKWKFYKPLLFTKLYESTMTAGYVGKITRSYSDTCLS